MLISYFIFPSWVCASEERDFSTLNSLGLESRSKTGARINHTQAQLLTAISPFQSAAPTPPARAKAAGAAITDITSAAAPIWQYSIWGTNLGKKGLFALGSGANKELWMTRATYGDFWAPDAWMVLRWDGSAFQQVAVRAPYESAIVRMMPFPGDAKVAVALEDGEVFIYNAASHLEVEYYDFGATVGTLSDFAIADLDADGSPELICLGGSGLAVFSSSGILQWSKNFAGATELAVGQLDTDPALEIVISGDTGWVMDGGTRKIQWAYPGSFGRTIVLANLDADSPLEIIGTPGWYSINGYDLSRKVRAFTITTDLDVGTLAVADVTADGIPELLMGDGQWGQIYAYNLANRKKLWAIDNPNHGTTQIAAVDLNLDGKPEILWGAGATSTGADNLYITDGVSREITYTSPALDGPFIGPVIGDVDGDGISDLVVCSRSSESGYNSGRILVFDRFSHALKGISPPVIDNLCWEGVNDLKLRHVTPGKAMEILVAGDHLYDGAAEVYSFENAEFTRIWTNKIRPEEGPFTCVDVADINGDGVPEIITSTDLFVRAYDFATQKLLWRSPELTITTHEPIRSLWVGAFHLTGKLEILAATGGSGIFGLDAKTGNIMEQISGNFSFIAPLAASSFFAAGSDGIISIFTSDGKKFRFTGSRKLAAGPINFLLHPNPHVLYYGVGGVIYRERVNGQFSWQSEALGSRGPYGAVCSPKTGEIYTTTDYGVAAFSLAP